MAPYPQAQALPVQKSRFGLSESPSQNEHPTTSTQNHTDTQDTLDLKNQLKKVPPLSIEAADSVIYDFQQENPIHPLLSSLFVALPKAERHVHLGGARPKRIIRKMLERNGLDDETIAKLTGTPERFKNLTHFNTFYDILATGAKEPQQLRIATYLICKKAAEDNVKYLALRIGLADETETPDTILNAIRQGISEAKEDLSKVGYTQQVRVIVAAKRHGRKGEDIKAIVARAMKDAKLAVHYAKHDPDKLVVGFDIAGDESRYPLYHFKDVIHYVKQQGLPVTVHAGETPMSGNITGAASVNLALEYGVNGIGHALFATHDAQVMKRLKATGTIVESCPTSNVAIGNTSWKTHPIRTFLDAGIPVSVCTDDPGVFKTKISKEYERLYKHGLVTSWQDFKTITRNAAKGVFLPASEKKQLIQSFERQLQALEQNPLYQPVIRHMANISMKSLPSSTPKDLTPQPPWHHTMSQLQHKLSLAQFYASPEKGQEK
jgi:adenosine deaminase